MTHSILQKVLARIKPGDAKLREAHRFVRELDGRLGKANLLAQAVLGGSTAKGTYLKEDHDIDIFVRFNRKAYASEALSDLLAGVLPEASRVHGSRDYYQLRRSGYLFEIVPVLAIDAPDQAQNVTDASPLHVAFVLSHLKRTPSLADEIRLAKRFCKAVGVYGAESHIQGFSGHVLDILVIRYGSFLGLLRAAANWPAFLVLDPAGHHRDPQTALPSEKQSGPLLLVDPIQPERNAAAAVSGEQFKRFQAAAHSFLEKPTLKHFEIRPLTPARIRTEYARQRKKYGVPTDLLIMTMEGLDGREDVVATKLRKAHEQILRGLQKEGFQVLDAGWAYSGTGLGYIVVPRKPLSKVKVQAGPPVREKKDAVRFRRKHKGTYEEKGKLYATVARKFHTARSLVKELLQDEYIQRRCTKARLLRKV